jgi:hypothetical protein
MKRSITLARQLRQGGVVVRAKVVSALGCIAASDAVVVLFAAAQLHRIYMVNARRGHRKPRKGRTVQHFSNTTLL